MKLRNKNSARRTGFYAWIEQGYGILNIANKETQDALMNKLDRLDGYVEVWGEVRTCQLINIKSGDPSIYISDDLCDGFDSFEDFLESCKGKLYLTLEDYKQDKFISIPKFYRSVYEKPN